MKFLLPYQGLVIAIVLTIFSGTIYRYLTAPSADLAEVAKRFNEIPKEFGDWKMDKEEPMTDQVVSTLECAGYLNGSFINQVTGQRVNAFIVLGPPGPISVHTPEVCYSSKDYDIKETREHTEIGKDGELGTLWSLTMRQTSTVSAELLRVYYGWASQDIWTAPESPRFTYGGDPLLFKIQLASYLPPETDLKTNDSCRSFLESFLPHVNRVLLKPEVE